MSAAKAALLLAVHALTSPS